jgi:hypothetical protein
MAHNQGHPDEKDLPDSKRGFDMPAEFAQANG